MYYFSEIELKKLTKDLLPRVRYENAIDDSLRGWNWEKEPLRPYSDRLLLPVWEVAVDVCPTRRDAWLRRTLKKSIPTTIHHVRGILVHKIVAHIFSKAKRYLYLKQENLGDTLRADCNCLFNEELERLSKTAKLSEKFKKDMKIMCKKLIEFEIKRIESRVEEIMSKYPLINEDTLVHLALPAVTELVIDGSLLGLSRCLKLDATNLFGGIIFDVKTGKKEEWHRVQVAGYALAFESFFEMPADIGCVVYIDIVNNNLKIEKDLFVISDHLRAQFVERRDELQMILLRGKEPKVAENCPKSCIFRGWVCH